MKNVEIERKWLMVGFPDLPYEREVIQTQGYLSFEPATVRIRMSVEGEATSCFLTIKGKGLMSRTEVELPLAWDQYEALRPLLIAPTAEKRLRTYKLKGGHVLECSVVDEGHPDAFFYGEIEFENEEEAREFVAPGWLGREVTRQAGFTMAAYCRKKAEKAKGKSDQ